MRSPEQVKWDFVQDWLRKADSDLKAARLLAAQEFLDYEAAAFHAQQCAEKMIKAYLVRHQVEFPKTHDIRKLRNIVATIDRGLAESLSEADILSPYSVEFRYPGDLEIISKETALQAVSIAEEVSNLIQKKLEEYLRKGRPK